LKDLTSAPLPSADFVRGMLAVGYGMVFVYSLRGAGMYALTTTTLLRQVDIMPKWLALVSYLVATFLLLSTVMHPAAMLLFPPGWSSPAWWSSSAPVASPNRPHLKGNPRDYIATA
jgi:hypothetical protein